ncbi:MAG: 2-C-methyl-D-erythritol 2,4-cyclodiphosphate synthase [Candidatus Omnitrophica bacterium]|nr:2-C-methyl-D-erythritol 2,4-cyclodiphosphate synthase [Candidatus Omnitrophota bacterium]
MRVGIGFDIHRLVDGRSLLLGGVKIPYGKGLLGHSDGDVLLHAVCDAILGAVGAGDIGSYFPDSDPKWKGASSALFIDKAMELADRRDLRVANVDAVILAEEPKLSPHRSAIQRSVAQMLRVKDDKVNVKAKTMEQLGPIGQAEAVAAQVVVLLEDQ